jgi:anti-anti-sigma factor
MAETVERAIVQRRNGVTVIDMPTHIDISTEAALDTAYSEVSPKGAILLNFSGTQYINSSGIALIVGILARARKQSRPISAYGLSAHYREIFEVTRLSDFMGLYGDEQAAIAGKR